MGFYKFLLPLIWGATLFAACSNDDDKEGEEGDSADKAANQWAYEQMRESYLWRDQMPSSPNYDKEYDYFFKSLLSLEDGKHWFDDENNDGGYYYSSIRKYVGKADSTATRADVEYLTSSFGFDYTLTQSFLYDERISEINRYAKLYATVAWVTPGSQAYTSGLKRGDHIYKIDNTEFPEVGYGKLLAKLSAPLSGTSTVSFTVCELNQMVDEETGELIYIEGVDNSGNVFPVPLVTRSDNTKDKSYTLTSDFLSENPLYHASVLEVGGKNVGYMVYNQFNSGAKYTSEQGAYDTALKDAFDIFKSRGIDELVVDLRYNSGGQTSSCELLGSLVVPSSKAGTTFWKQVDVNGNSTPHTFSSQPNSVGLPKIYVIATGDSASASELFLHCLKAAGVEVFHIGTTTEGKNVGQSPQDTENLPAGSDRKKAMGSYNYLLYPVTFRVVDANDQTYPSTGIDPRQNGGYEFKEGFVVDFKNLGDPEEPMLALALYHIENGRWPADTRGARVTRSSRFAGFTGSIGRGIPRHIKPSKGIIADR